MALEIVEWLLSLLVVIQFCLNVQVLLVDQLARVLVHALLTPQYAFALKLRNEVEPSLAFRVFCFSRRINQLSDLAV